MTRKLSVLTSVERRFKGPGTGARRGGFVFRIKFCPSISYVDMYTATFDKAASSFITCQNIFSPIS